MIRIGGKSLQSGKINGKTLQAVWLNNKKVWPEEFTSPKLYPFFQTYGEIPLEMASNYGVGSSFKCMEALGSSGEFSASSLQACLSACIGWSYQIYPNDEKECRTFMNAHYFYSPWTDCIMKDNPSGNDSNTYLYYTIPKLVTVKDEYFYPDETAFKKDCHTVQVDIVLRFYAPKNTGIFTDQTSNNDTKTQPYAFILPEGTICSSGMVDNFTPQTAIGITPYDINTFQQYYYLRLPCFRYTATDYCSPSTTVINLFASENMFLSTHGTMVGYGSGGNGSFQKIEIKYYNNYN